MPKITNLLQGEWIGLKINVIGAQNKVNLGIEGTVVDETKFFIIIKTQRGIKKVPKKGAVFQMHHLGRKINISGDLLIASPEERIKTKV